MSLLTAASLLLSVGPNAAAVVGPPLGPTLQVPPELQGVSTDLTVWPNVRSRANSDPWLVQNHDSIRRMEPRVLVLNFCNGLSEEAGRKKVEDLIAALAESSRFHGYEDPNAPVFLQPRLAKYVDLSDPEPAKETPDGNSTKCPRVPNWTGGINFRYKDLYSEKFAEYYGYKDPRNPARYLRLNELVDRGIINELWFLAYQRAAGAPFESTERKPVYDENFKRVGNENRHSGNGGDPEEPWFGRSLRILFINAERGVGCAMESLGHSFEGMAHSNVIPYFRKYFYEYAGFDLDKRYGLPFNSLYHLWGEGKGVSYPDPSTAVVKDGEKTYTLKNYVAIGGNVHFTPNGRGHYDLESPYPVMSAIENYRLRNGPGGKDKTEPFTVEKFAKYRELAGDCMGPWLVYWRQNMPNYKSKAVDDEGKPMKNWWVFLYY